MAVVLMLCCLSACGKKNDDASAEKTIRIGVFEPTSGNSGAGGKKETIGIQYAYSKNSTIEIDGETYDIELVYADNASDSRKAVQAAKELVKKNVSVVIGSYGSRVSIAASDVFRDAQVPVIGATCTNPAVTQDNSHYFRICFNDSLQGEALASFAAGKLSALKAYCLGEADNEYDHGLIGFFSKAFENAGGKTVTDFFSKDNSDFSYYINKAKSEDCDVIFCPVSITYAVQIINQASKLDVNIPVLGADTFDDNAVLAAAKGTDIRLYTSSFCAQSIGNGFETGVRNYISNNINAELANGSDDTVSAVTAMGYDAYGVALEAVRIADSADSAKIMKALPKVIYTGISGPIMFDKAGDAVRDTVYIKSADTISGTWLTETQQISG